MALSRADQRRIMRDDVKRRNAREALEDATLLRDTSYCPDGVDPYHYDRSITGVPTQGNRNFAASRSSWERGLRGRTVGIAPGTEDDSDGTPTVAVIIDGVTEIRPVSSFRDRAPRMTPVRRTTAVVPETATVTLKGMDWSQ